MSVINNSIIAGAAGQSGGAAGYEIERSLRFNSGDSAYLSRPNSTAGEQRVMTFSWWMKANDTSSSADQIIFGQDYNTSGDVVTNRSLNIVYYQGKVGIYDYGASDAAGNTGASVAWTPGYINSDAVFRDPSAWYHFVIAVDTTQNEAADRVKVYVNGVQQTHSSYPVQNSYLSWGQARNEYIGGHFVNSGYTRSLNAQLADVQFVAGLQLPAYYFGEFDANNVWQPKAFDNGGATVNDGTTFSSISGALGSAAYDGDTSTSFNAVSGTYYKISSGFTVANSLRVFARQDEQWQYRSTEQNQINLVRAASGPVYGWIDVPVTGTQTNPEIRVTSGGSPIYAIEVDGVIMVDSTTTTLAYGNNGFKLDFADNSSTTSGSNVGIGKDTSGNSNYWDSTNISVTAGTGNDSLFDSPTNGTQTDSGAGGEVSGNYATLNPLDIAASASLSNGNLEITATTSYQNAKGTIGLPTSGKWYFEVATTTTGPAAGANIGLATSGATLTAGYLGASNVYMLNAVDALRFYNQTTEVTATGSVGSSDIMQLAYDADNGKAWIGINNTWYDSSGGTTGNPSAGTNQTFSIPSVTMFPYVGGYQNTAYANFGQRPFAYTAPSGYKALCTANLPTPDIADGSTAMDVALYTGNSSTQTISGLEFSPDLVWIKCRNNSVSHALFDVVRGVNNTLVSNSTGAEETSNTFGTVSAFNTDGFTVATGSTDAYRTNQNTFTYAGWAWDGGSSTVSNTDGSITSSVRANASAGFSIVTFTCPSSGGYSFGHGLGVTPSMVIMKGRDLAGNVWAVYHSSVNTFNDYLGLSSTAAVTSSPGIWGAGINSSVVGSTANNGVAANTNAVAYCWAPVEGYSAFGSYEAILNVNGPFVYTGFRPKWIMIKNVDDTASPSSYGWTMIDTSRYPYNASAGNLNPLYANANYKENSYSDGNHPAAQLALDVLSNGFKLRSANYEINFGQTYIYAAFAENPFKIARAR